MAITGGKRRMTDNEIIKALNYCCGNIKNNDEECNEDMCYQVNLSESRDEGARWCRQWLIKDALDLINRQKAIIKKSENVEHFADKTIETANAEIERLNIELQSMRSAANSYKMHYETAKFEAIKEFARELKCGVPQETGVIRCADVDNLVKEMEDKNV